MFKINSYLQFQNTPDGKPRVLVEGVDYEYKDSKHLFKDFRAIEDYLDIINLSDCRGLLELKNKKELDIFNYFYPSNELKDKKWVDTNTYHLLSFNGKNWTISDFKLLTDNTKTFYGNWHLLIEYLNIDYNPTLQEPRAKFEKIGNFADDPAKYSKLLWNCTEEEGWEKVLELLGVNNK